jgi:hypothetical protein
MATHGNRKRTQTPLDRFRAAHDWYVLEDQQVLATMQIMLGDDGFDSGSYVTLHACELHRDRRQRSAHAL